MKITQVLHTVHEFFSEHLSVAPHRIPTVRANDRGWDVVVEVIEDKQYMIEHAQHELVGAYSVQVDQNLEVVSYFRTSLRPRGTDTPE
jgi:hypothetical protein